tara:strand:+ start:5226 stop:5447 length:222 start_codon:yes stop_codon:yes gene_type:complete
MKANTEMLKKAIIQENDDLKYWLTYIRYRAKNHWTGKNADFCSCDLENIMLRIENDLFESSLKKETTLRNSKA